MLKIMLLIVVLACVGPFFIKAPNGNPLLSISDFTSGVSVDSIIEGIKKAPGLAELADGIKISGDAADGEQGKDKSTSGSVTKVFKWRDEQGVWQFSDGPNVAEGAALVEISNQINLIPALEVTGQDASKASVADAFTTSLNSATQANEAGGFDLSKLPAGLTSVAPEQLMQMGQTIEAFQKALDAQGRTLEELAPKQPR
jgi:hypothetical protein